MPFLSDTFTETSDTALGSHTPDVGGTWTVFTAGGMTVAASEDRVRGDSSSTSGAAYNSASPASDQYDVEAVVRRTTSDANPLGGIYVRYDTAGPHYVQMYMSQPDSLLVMQEVQSGAVSESSTYSKTWTADLNYAFKIEARNGSNGVKGYLDGTQRVQITWSGGSTPGKAGVRARLYGRVDSVVGTDYVTTVDLVIADALHTHAVDNLALTQDHVLAVADAAHAHSADNLTLTTETALAIADALHAHAADSVTLTQAHVLAIQDALHAHAADQITLSVGGTDLVIADALHAHGVDHLALTQTHVLVVSDALHAHLADVLSLSIPGALVTDSDRVLVVRGEGRTLVILRESRVLTVPLEARSLRVH